MRRPDAPGTVLAVLAGALLTFSVLGWFRLGDDRGDGDGQPSGGTAVAVVDFAFEPTPLSVVAGDTVTWTNEDEAAHTVTSVGEGALASENVPEGGTFEHTFEEAGVYEYLCTIHPTMTGTVEVSGA